MRKTAKYDWIFWLSIDTISIYPGKISMWKWCVLAVKCFRLIPWKTRGANALEIQWLIFKLSVGLPWLELPFDRYGTDHIDSTNKANLNNRFSIKIKR